MLNPSYAHKPLANRKRLDLDSREWQRSMGWTHMIKVGMIGRVNWSQRIFLTSPIRSLTSLSTGYQMSAIECPSLLAAIHPRFSRSIRTASAPTGFFRTECRSRRRRRTEGLEAPGASREREVHNDQRVERRNDDNRNTHE